MLRWVYIYLLLVSAPAILATNNNQIETVPYVIIGAGTAGVFAANTFAANNISTVILEARNRIGGRMDTRFVSGYPHPIEMGCSFVHDGNVSPWPNISAVSGLPLEEWDDFSLVFVENGQRLDANTTEDIINEFFGYWGAHFNYSQLGRSDREAMFLAGYVEVDNRIEAFMQVAETSPAINLEYHDSTGWSPYSDEEYGAKYIIPDGYRQLLDYVFHNYSLASQGLRLRSEVTKIDFTARNGDVVISYTDLTTMASKRIKATQGVIITLPIGVLKAGTVKFTPSLPRAVRYSINKVSFGDAMKVALFFDWSVQERLAQDEVNWYWRIPQGTNPRYTDGIVVIWNYAHVYGQPVLQSFFVGDYAAYLETLTDQQIINLHMTKIREFLPNLPYPVNYLISRWGQDPYARGVYADYALGTTNEDFSVLLDGIGPQKNIFLAGEGIGTWTDSFLLDQGTTNQAATTGTWAAEKLIRQCH